MEDLLAHPAVQGGVAPFIVALIVASLLQFVRLGGLAVAAAFCTAVYLVAGFSFTPLSATRKIIVLGIASPVVGVLIDFAFRPNRIGAVLLALACAASAVWVFWPVLAQKPPGSAWLLGAAAAAAVAFMVWFAQTFLATDPVRAGSAGLGTGLGVGIASIFAASATFGLYGIALAAGCGAFLLVQMIRGRPGFAGATFTLPAMLTAGLIGAGAMILAQLPWHSLVMLALVPLAARMPGPSKAPVWIQAIVFSFYAFVIAGMACVLAWQAPG